MSAMQDAAKHLLVCVGQHKRHLAFRNHSSGGHGAHVGALLDASATSSVSMFTVASGRMSVGMGFIATVATSGSPVVMPPSRRLRCSMCA